MTLRQLVQSAVAIAVVAGLATAGYFTRQVWLPWIHPLKPVESVEAPGEAVTPTEKIIVSDKALENLGLADEARKAKPLKAGTFWKTITVPGMVVDRPGFSDRGIVSPLTGVVSAIHHVAGDTVRAGEVLFTLKLLSESLHVTQTDLFKATEDIKLAQEKLKRVKKLAAIGSESQLNVVEVESQIARLEVAVKAYRQELRNRGLSAGEIDRVTEGKFVSEITVVAPPRTSGQKPLTAEFVSGPGSGATPLAFEVQELKVELGQQVQAGQTLCLLANHQALSVEGRAFVDETALLERSVKEGWSVDVDFQENTGADWPEVERTFPIRYIANTIDPATRTFAFLMPLENQSRPVERDGRTQLLWRFRPGQKVRLRVKVEELKSVFVLPADAVVREGPEAFVFTQNVNTFERIGVRVLFQDRGRTVIANDGSLPTYTKDKDLWTISAVARTAAAQLNRMAKAGSSAVPKGYHIHADGSLHKNEDEDK